MIARARGVKLKHIPSRGIDDPEDPEESEILFNAMDEVADALGYNTGADYLDDLDEDNEEVNNVRCLLEAYARE